MRRAVSDLIEVCSNARAQAILRGKAVDVIFHPVERRFEVSEVAAPRSDECGRARGRVETRPAAVARHRPGGRDSG